MPREKAAALHPISARFHRILLINPGRQIGLVVLFRDFDGYVHPVVFNYREDEGYIGRWFLLPHAARALPDRAGGD